MRTPMRTPNKYVKHIHTYHIMELTCGNISTPVPWPPIHIPKLTCHNVHTPNQYGGTVNSRYQVVLVPCYHRTVVLTVSMVFTSHLALWLNWALKWMQHHHILRFIPISETCNNANSVRTLPLTSTTKLSHPKPYCHYEFLSWSVSIMECYYTGRAWNV